jgi:hypothetical protein
VYNSPVIIPVSNELIKPKTYVEPDGVIFEKEEQPKKTEKKQKIIRFFILYFIKNGTKL